MDWITDRLPTREDGDYHGGVLALTDGGGGWYTTPWWAIRLGDLWLPFRAFEQNPKNEQRLFVQLSATNDGYAVAVADDGTAWQYVPRDHAWRRLPNLPNGNDNDN